jgi:hypothetical protein
LVKEIGWSIMGISDDVQDTNRYDSISICSWQSLSSSGSARTQGILGNKRDEPQFRHHKDKMKNPN